MAAILVGCSAEKSNEKRGTFFDYPVEGLHYAAQPSGLSGTTDQEGGYGYRDGDRLTFVLGDISPRIDSRRHVGHAAGSGPGGTGRRTRTSPKQYRYADSVVGPQRQY